MKKSTGIAEKIEQTEIRIEEKIEEKIEKSVPNSKKYVKITLITLILTTLAYLYFFTPVKSYITQQAIANFVNGFGVLAPLAFIVIYVVALLFFLPATLFTVFGGVIFGLLWGTVYVVIAATLAACLGFMITRKFSGVSRGKHKNKLVKTLVDKCHHHCEKNGLQAFIIMRLLFLPYMPLSYAAGLVKSARLRDFALATFLTNIIGSFTFVFLGSQLQNGLKALILPVVLIVGTLLIPKVVKKFRKEETS
jgi:uncharacterized membrane protein YdjX (TVP38/TMEM64 family)